MQMQACVTSLPEAFTNEQKVRGHTRLTPVKDMAFSKPWILGYRLKSSGCLSPASPASMMRTRTFCTCPRWSCTHIYAFNLSRAHRMLYSPPHLGVPIAIMTTIPIRRHDSRGLESVMVVLKFIDGNYNIM